MKKILLILIIFLFTNVTFADELSQDMPIKAIEDAILKGRIEIVEDYIDKGKLKNPSINSIYLFKAVVNNQPEIVKLLLKEGVSPDSKYNKLPVIFFAIHRKNPQILNILLSYGANPENDVTHLLLGNKNVSPLIYSIIRKDLSCVKLLVNFGADVNRISMEQSPLSAAIMYKQTDIVKYLLQAGATPNETSQKALKRTNSEIKKLFAQ